MLRGACAERGVRGREKEPGVCVCVRERERERVREREREGERERERERVSGRRASLRRACAERGVRGREEEPGVGACVRERERERVREREREGERERERDIEIYIYIYNTYLRTRETAIERISLLMIEKTPTVLI